MRKRTARFIPLAIVALAAATALHAPRAAAQGSSANAARSGSIYSNIGFGLPSDVMSAHTEGMGLSGVALYDPGTPGFSNPAHWGLPGYTLANLSLGLDNYRAEDRFGSASNTLFAVRQFQFVAPIRRNRFGLSVSVSPVARTNYRVFREGTFVVASDTVAFGADNYGSGGVNRMEGGVGFRLTDRLYVGYAMSALIAAIEKENVLFFSSSNYVPVSYSERVNGIGYGQRLGLYYQRPPEKEGGNAFSAGAAISLASTIRADRSLSGYKTVGGLVQQIDLETDPSRKSGDLRMPMEINGGITYSFGGYLYLSGEVLHQRWESATYSFDREHEQSFTDRSRLGLGVQYLPFRRVSRNAFFHNIRYSSGVSYDSGHLVINGARVQTLSAHLGLGLLNRRSTSTVDITLRAGLRGETSNDLVREAIWGVGVSLNLAELMFIRPKFQ